MKGMDGGSQGGPDGERHILPGLLLKREELPLASGLGVPVVTNLAVREVSAHLSTKCGHSDPAGAPGWGWVILCAPTVQAVYDLNPIGLKLAESPRGGRLRCSA